jgi:hypothetical protein
MWSFNAHRSRLLDVAKADKLTLLTLGAHVRKLIQEENTKPWTMDGEDGGFQWTDVPTEVFVPVSRPVSRVLCLKSNRQVLDLPTSRERFTSVTCSGEDNHSE